MNTISDTGAIFSNCKNYRYALWRIWEKSKPMIMFIGLNPSTADAEKNDPTIRRCIDFANSWEYGGLYVTNLFAFRATRPPDLFKAKDPVGKQNDKYIKIFRDRSSATLAAWGNHGAFMERNLNILNILRDPYCLNINKSGHPAHPLYQKSLETPKPYRLEL